MPDPYETYEPENGEVSAAIDVPGIVCEDPPCTYPKKLVKNGSVVSAKYDPDPMACTVTPLAVPVDAYACTHWPAVR